MARDESLEKEALMSIETNCPQARQKKMNKRRIIKGRPDVLTLIKKRKFLTALAEEQPPVEKCPNSQAEIRNTINEILNKNTLLKYITTKNDQQIQKNLY